MTYHTTIETKDLGLGTWSRLRANLSSRNVSRWAVLAVLLGYGFLVLQGTFLPEEKIWVRLTVIGVVTLGLFCVLFSSDHFLKEHLWDHVIRQHLPRVFLWILGTLIVVSLLHHSVDIRALISNNRWLVLGLAALVGVIPTSGPHLVFISLFLEGLAPFSVLLVNAIVQDGHGGLPLMAFDRRAFMVAKLVKLAGGLAIGMVVMALGY